MTTTKNKKNNEEQIDSVRIYQPVMFDKKNETHFSTRATAKKQVTVEYHEFLPAVVITSKTDKVIVPFTNVSGIYLKSPIKQEAAQAAEKEQEKLKDMAETRQNKVRRPS